MKFLILFILLFSIGCKKQVTTVETGSGDYHTNNGVSEPIQSFINSFQTRYNTVVSLPVFFDTSNDTGSTGASGTTVGVCKIYNNGYREVVINKEWWDCSAKNINGTCAIPRSNSDKEILVYHELGHCVFNRDHDFELTSSGQKICLSINNGVCTAYKYRLDSSNNNRPVSMMYPVINPIADNYVLSNTYYQYELQNQKPQSWETNQNSAWTIAYNNYQADLASHALADTNYRSYGIKTSAMTDASQAIPHDSDFENSNVEPSQDNGSCVEFIQ